MQNHLLVLVTLGTCAACGGTSSNDHLAPDASAAIDVSQPMDAAVDQVPNPSGWDGSIVIDPRPKDSGSPIASDVKIDWPRSDSAVPTPDADTWDAGAECPASVPLDGDPCNVETGCAYPIDCCGIIAGFVRAYCQSGKWFVLTQSNGELCAPCVPFPQAGDRCSLEAACQPGPPPICLRLTCYGGTDVARCVGDQWTVVPGCIK